MNYAEIILVVLIGVLLIINIILWSVNRAVKAECAIYRQAVEDATHNLTCEPQDRRFDDA